jgi:hypothetical protein
MGLRAQLVSLKRRISEHGVLTWATIDLFNEFLGATRAQRPGDRTLVSIPRAGPSTRVQDVVRWIDELVASLQDPERPAPARATARQSVPVEPTTWHMYPTSGVPDD